MTLALPTCIAPSTTACGTIDIGTLTEAAQIAGANQVQIIFWIILPNVLVAIISGAFLTFAIVIGEFTNRVATEPPRLRPLSRRHRHQQGL